MSNRYGLSDKRYKHMLKVCSNSEEEVLSLVKYWGVESCERGYIVTNYDGMNIFCIERIDALQVFANDTEATRKAVADGIKIIPIKQLPKNMPEELKFFGWVDTTKNRESLQERFK